jgi:histidinol-phosphate aminotransferase
MSYFRPAIDDLQSYEPGEQPATGDRMIKLNTNENPYPPSAKALQILKSIEPDGLRQYPRPFADEFRAAAAKVLGFKQEWILVGNGSDDILTMLLRSVTETSRPVAYPIPTYSLYRTLALIQAAPAMELPFDDLYNLPVEALVESQAALTLVANPNSPSGTRAPNKLLTEIASRLNGILVIDEAYAEFASENALELTRHFENVVVLRSLSKSHSLAGLRLGFAVAQPSLISGLSKSKDSYNVDAVSARVGAAAILDTTHTQKNVARVCASRSHLAKTISDLGYRVWPSEANFLLVRPPDGNANEVCLTLKTHSILVRHFDEPMLYDKLRITIGTNEQNAKLIKILTEVVNRRPESS